MAAVSRGADIHACGPNGSVRQAAERLLVSMDIDPDKKYGWNSWKEIMAEIKETIAYIDSASISSATNESPGSIAVLEDISEIVLGNELGRPDI